MTSCLAPGSSSGETALVAPNRSAASRRDATGSTATISAAPLSRAPWIAEIPTPLGRFFTRIVETTLAFDESVGIPGSTHPDSLTAAVLLHPELVTAEARYHVDVETGSDLTRGYSAMSWGVHGLEPNARVIEAIDSEGFFAYIQSLLRSDEQPSRTIHGI